MKQSKLLTFALWFALIITMIFVIKENRYFDENVKQSMVEIYDEYLSQQDSVMKSKQLLSTRAALQELVIDSAAVSKEWKDWDLFIVRPRKDGDSLINGQLHQIYWEKINRQKISYFEKLR